ncbi:hypothetical protein ACFQ6Q_40345 [Streptomyces sp. NPDC056437]
MGIAGQMALVLTSPYVASADFSTPPGPEDQEDVMSPCLTAGAGAVDTSVGTSGSAVPSSWLLVAAMLVAALVALVAAILHRHDGASAVKAVKRGGVAFVCTVPLGLSVLLDPLSLPTTVVLLGAMITAVINGALEHAEGGSVPACLWQAAVAFTSVTVVGLGCLAVYGLGHAA